MTALASKIKLTSLQDCPGACDGAGIRAAQLERLEAALAADLASEAEAWGGRLLLHAEPWAYLPANSSGGVTQLMRIVMVLLLQQGFDSRAQ